MKRIYILSSLALFSAALIWADDLTPDNWINVYTNENGKTRVTTAPAESVSKISYQGSNGGYTDMIYEYEKDGQTKSEKIDISKIKSVEIAPNVPTLIFTTYDKPYLTEIQSKDDYENMTIEVKGYGVCKDVDPSEGTMKGRGNSTWAQFPKKPYRLKFKKKIEICGLMKAKSYVLLANYIDPSMLRNAVAFKIAEMLGMPYVNHSVPVNVIFNGINKGAYQLTEKIGFNDASLPIKDEEGILFCLETQDNIDEDFYAKSSNYGVYYMVKDPDFYEVSETTGESVDAMWKRWREDFQKFESAIPNGDIEKYLDLESLVNYLFVYNITGNREAAHPKSVYMYKENPEAVYKMGPVWDFDWAYTFDGNYWEGDGSPTRNLLGSGGAGGNFFTGLIRNSKTNQKFLDLYRLKWEYFKTQLPVLWDYIDEYAEKIKASAAENGELWPTEEYNRSKGRNVGSTDVFPQHVENLKNWLRQRIDFIDARVNSNFGLY